MKTDERAINPVWATVLMVAITVVLAAVLYVMVLGFSEDIPEEKTPRIYQCDCGWSGYLSDCESVVTCELSTTYDMIQERMVTVQSYYNCYLCPDCGELVKKTFLYEVKL